MSDTIRDLLLKKALEGDAGALEALRVSHHSTYIAYFSHIPPKVKPDEQVAQPNVEPQSEFADRIENLVKHIPMHDTDGTIKHK